MGCRRGRSWGHVSCQTSSTTLDPSSRASNFCCDRYPMARSGSGRGRGKFIIEVHSHHSHSHTTCFYFPSTLGNSSFIASVIVELCEDVVGSGHVSLGAPLESRMEDQNVSKKRDTGGSAILDLTTHVGPSAPVGGDPSSTEGHPSEFEDPD